MQLQKLLQILLSLSAVVSGEVSGYFGQQLTSPTSNALSGSVEYEIGEYVDALETVYTVHSGIGGNSIHVFFLNRPQVALVQSNECPPEAREREISGCSQRGQLFQQALHLSLPECLQHLLKHLRTPHCSQHGLLPETQPQLTRPIPVQQILQQVQEILLHGGVIGGWQHAGEKLHAVDDRNSQLLLIEETQPGLSEIIEEGLEHDERALAGLVEKLEGYLLVGCYPIRHVPEDHQLLEDIGVALDRPATSEIGGKRSVVPIENVLHYCNHIHQLSLRGIARNALIKVEELLVIKLHSAGRFEDLIDSLDLVVIDSERVDESEHSLPQLHIRFLKGLKETLKARLIDASPLDQQFEGIITQFDSTGLAVVLEYHLKEALPDQPLRVLLFGQMEVTLVQHIIGEFVYYLATHDLLLDGRHLDHAHAHSHTQQLHAATQFLPLDVSQQFGHVVDHLIQELLAHILHQLLGRATEQLLQSIHMSNAQVLDPLLHDIVVHIVQQSQVLANHSHPHLLKLGLELGQVAHDDLDAPAEEASLEGTDPRPLPPLLALLRHPLRTQLAQEQPAIAGEEVADHLAAAQRVILEVVGRAEPADCEQETLNECFQGARQFSEG